MARLALVGPLHSDAPTPSDDVAVKRGRCSKQPARGGTLPNLRRVARASARRGGGMGDAMSLLRTHRAPKLAPCPTLSRWLTRGATGDFERPISGTNPAQRLRRYPHGPDRSPDGLCSTAAKPTGRPADPPRWEIVGALRPGRCDRASGGARCPRRPHPGTPATPPPAVRRHWNLGTDHPAPPSPGANETGLGPLPSGTHGPQTRGPRRRGMAGKTR